MPDSASSLRETLLRQCLASDPGIWSPRDYGGNEGVDRESLYGPLNDLRIANLVQLSEWVAGKGQGYTITPLGKEVLSDPLFLAQLREGKAKIAPTPAVEAPARQAGTTFEIGEAARRAIFEPGRTVVAPILIAVNIVVFLISLAVAIREGVPIGRFLAGGEVVALQTVGAVTAEDLAQGEWWRLIANCFLHFGLMHLVLNMFSLMLLRRVERLWGSGRFLILYLTCGLCGSCAGVYYFPGDLQSIVYLAGASGALWGLMASEAVWLLLNRSHLPIAEVRRWNQQLLFTLLLNIGVSMLPHVSAAAHVGGGVAGAISALLLQVHRYGSPRRKTLAGVGLAFLPTIFLIGLSLAYDKDPRLQMFLVSAYREEIDARVGSFPAKLSELETQADLMHLEQAANRDPSRVRKLQENLEALVAEANAEGKWVEDSTNSTPTQPLKQRSEELLITLTFYAEALGRYANGENVENINERRKNWQEALQAWKALAK